MSAAFIRPIAFTVPASSPAPVAGSATLNMNLDVPGKVWRGNAGSSNFIVDLGANPSFDFIALVGTNLRSSDTVTVSTGTSTSGTGSYNSGALPAWTGIKPDIGSAITIIALPALRSERYVRIDISAPLHPAGYVEVQRLVIGKGARVVGIEYDLEASYNGRHDETSGPGYSSTDVYDSPQSVKFRTAFIYETEYRTNWIPLFRYAAQAGSVLFIPEIESPDFWITDAVFGKLDKAGGKRPIINAWVYEGTVTSLSM